MKEKKGSKVYGTMGYNNQAPLKQNTSEAKANKMHNDYKKTTNKHRSNTGP